jgi:hypothetical protein
MDQIHEIYKLAKNNKPCECEEVGIIPLQKKKQGFREKNSNETVFRKNNLAIPRMVNTNTTVT